MDDYMEQQATGSDFELEIREYFSSIEDAFESTLKVTLQRESSPLDAAIITSVVSTFLSVVPILPLVFWALVKWLFEPRQLILFGRHIRIGSFWFWYAVLATLSILAAATLIWIDNKRGEQSDEVLLDAAPMRFALCYAIVQELDRYFKNRIPKHISQAVEYWPKLRQSLSSFLNLLYLRSGDVAIRQGILVTSISDPDLGPEITADMRAHGFLEPGYSKYHSLFPQIDLLHFRRSTFCGCRIHGSGSIRRR